MSCGISGERAQVTVGFYHSVGTANSLMFRGDATLQNYYDDDDMSVWRPVTLTMIDPATAIPPAPPSVVPAGGCFALPLLTAQTHCGPTIALSYSSVSGRVWTASMPTESWTEPVRVMY